MSTEKLSKNEVTRAIHSVFPGLFSERNLFKDFYDKFSELYYRSRIDKKILHNHWVLKSSHADFDRLNLFCLKPDTTARGEDLLVAQFIGEKREIGNKKEDRLPILVARYNAPIEGQTSNLIVNLPAVDSRNIIIDSSKRVVIIETPEYFKRRGNREIADIHKFITIPFDQLNNPDQRQIIEDAQVDEGTKYFDFEITNNNIAFKIKGFPYEDVESAYVLPISLKVKLPKKI